MKVVYFVCLMIVFLALTGTSIYFSQPAARNPPIVNMPFSIKRGDVLISFVNVSILKKISVTYNWRNPNQTILINKGLTMKNWSLNDVVWHIEADEGCKFVVIWLEYQNLADKLIKNKFIYHPIMELKVENGEIYKPVMFVNPNYLMPKEKIDRWAIFQVSETDIPSKLMLYERFKGGKEISYQIKLDAKKLN